MKRTVGIIGTGWVGSSVAISTLHSGIADELLLYDVREAVAEGEAMDLAHGASFYAQTLVRTAAIEEMTDADVIVIAAGRAGVPGQSRLELLRDNAALVSEHATYQVGGDQANRVIGCALSADDFVCGPPNLVGDIRLALVIPPAPFPERHSFHARCSPEGHFRIAVFAHNMSVNGMRVDVNGAADNLLQARGIQHGSGTYDPRRR